MLEAQARLAVEVQDGKGRQTQPGIRQGQLRAFGQVEAVIGCGVQHAVPQRQREAFLHIGPDAGQLQILQLQVAAGTERQQLQLAAPVECAARRPLRHELCLGLVIGAGAQVMQLEVERVVGEIDGFARAPVLEVHQAALQQQAVNAQREGSARFLAHRRRAFLAGWESEEPTEVEVALGIEQHFRMRAGQADLGQMQGALPQAAPLQIDMQLLEGQLRCLGRADVQVVQLQGQAERVELQPLQARGLGGVVGQLLIGDAQRHTGHDEEADQGIERQQEGQATGQAQGQVRHGGSASVDGAKYGSWI